MPQFPVTDSRKRILEKIPDYAVAISPVAGRVVVRYEGDVIASSDSALLIQETRHDDVYYLPAGDVEMEKLTATELSTYCPFKGHATYWSLTGVEDLENFVWAYPSPYPEVAGIKDHLSFYPNLVDISLER